jgi:predicted metal-dependent peptidase
LNDTGERLKNLIAEMTIKPGNENMSYNYFGYIFSRIRRVSDPNLPSIMGVAPTKDGKLVLLFNPPYFEGTSDEVLKKVIEHEGMHVLNKHIPRLLRILANEPDVRMKNAKMKIWNTAADCASNPAINMPRQVIIQNKPWESCFPDLYELEDNRPTEEYYFKLLDEAKQKAKEQQKKCDNCDGKGSNKSCPMSGKNDAGEDECQMPTSGDGMPIDGAHGGEGKDYDVIGNHSKWGDVTKEVADVSSLSRKIDGHIQEIIKDSVKNFSNRRGVLPGHIQSLIDSALEQPKIPYYQLIQKLIKGSRYSKFKRSLSRINRKRTYAFAIDEINMPAISPFPGKTRDFTFKIVVLIDTSGSMDNDDVKEGLSGCKNIIEKDRHCDVTVLENDTCLQKEYKLKRVSDIDFEVKGRGGTVLREGIERAREIDPDVMLCFTDGGCENINDFPRKSLPRKIIWVVQTDENGGNINTLDKTGYIVRVDNG